MRRRKRARKRKRSRTGSWPSACRSTWVSPNVIEAEKEFDSEDEQAGPDTQEAGGIEEPEEPEGPEGAEGAEGAEKHEEPEEPKKKKKKTKRAFGSLAEAFSHVLNKNVSASVATRHYGIGSGVGGTEEIARKVQGGSRAKAAG
jgi:hypothetical protein